MVRCSRQGRTSRPLHRFPESIPVLHLFHLPLERYTVQARFLTTSRGGAKLAITTLGATAGANDLHAITVRASKSVVLLYLTPFPVNDDVAAYSSHIATARKTVRAVAWSEWIPMPSPDVAGHRISPPGAATHLKVARWFNGTSMTSCALV